MPGRPDAMDPDFISWVVKEAGAITNTFHHLTFILSTSSPDKGRLKPDWWKGGMSPQYQSKMASDGLLALNGAAIELRIRGLTPGRHTLTTYHNAWESPDAHSSCPTHIGIEALPASTRVIPSNRVTHNADTAVAYLVFDVQSGEDAVIRFQPDPSFPSDQDKKVVLSGFELDRSDPRRKASKPIPKNREEHADGDNGALRLEWTAAASALSHDVFFGHDQQRVATATRSSPDFQGNQMESTFAAGDLKSMDTYYWRIDEVDSQGRRTRGDVWSFRIRHPAFPGAEGYGRFARGGRGGRVIEVTNLNDSGPGSFRDAVEASGPRTIVFNVSGLITLESRLVIRDSSVTIAGQTAPAKGICIRKYNFGLSGARDVIVRHLRVRPGNTAGVTLDGMGMQGSDHCIFDHCSISWSLDEAFSSRSARNITLQRTLISEALNQAGHDKYPPGTQHGYAASIGGMVGSFHHNLLAHCAGRNWSLAGGLDKNNRHTGWLDIRNNLVYNWRHRTTDGGAAKVNFVNNYYKPGPATSYFYMLNPERDNVQAFGPQNYYVSGNVMEGHHRANDPLSGVTKPEPYSHFIVDEPFFHSFVKTQSASQTYKQVLSDVGCNLPQMDDHDLRVIYETLSGSFRYRGSKTGLPGLPDSQEDVGGWEEYPETHRPKGWDTDRDGLPNWWEVLHGTPADSPKGDFSDSNEDPDGDGYTRLEDYLNWLAEPHFVCNRDEALEVDLSRYTRGFTDSPVHVIKGSSHGKAILLKDGKTARFTPSSRFRGLAGFRFTVTDSAGDSLNRTIGIRVN